MGCVQQLFISISLHKLHMLQLLSMIKESSSLAEVK